jgi:hypothetical protein
MRRSILSALLTVAALAGCKPSGGSSACGITALAGATMLLDQFAVPNQALSVAPAGAPEILPVRIAAGPAFRGTVAVAADTSWTVRVEGSLPPGFTPGYGVLVVGADGRPRGVMLYSGARVRGAPVIGSVAMPGAAVELIGLQTDVAGLEDPKCPFFPDSLARP